MNETEIDIRRLFGVLPRQLRLIAICMALAVGVVGIATFALTPKYTADATILVDPSEKNLLSSDAQIVANATENSRIDSEVELVKTSSTLLKVIANQSLLSDPEFGPELSLRDRVLGWLQLENGELPTGQEAVQQTLKKLVAAINVRRKGLTYLIELEVETETPQKSADLVNALAETYISTRLAAKVEGVLASRDVLQRRIQEASDAISTTESALDDYIFANLALIESETGKKALTDLRLQLKSVESRLATNKDLIDQIKLGLEHEDWASLAQSLQSDAIRSLEVQRNALVRKIAETPEAQRDVDLKAELAQIELNLRETAKNEQSGLQKLVSDAAGESSELRTQIRVEAMSSDLPPSILTEVFELQQNSTIARSQYQRLLSRLREVETQVDLQIADSQVVSPALPPDEQSFPNTKLFLALAGLMGLGIGVGLAYLNEYYFGGFTSEGQIETVLQRTVFSTVPKLKERVTGEKVKPADSMIESPLSGYAESVRRVCASVLQANQIRRQKIKEDPKKGSVIIVTSSISGEGKTTIALSIARSFALSGRKTLLIDADLRRPSVHKLLGLAPSSALFDYLAEPSSKPIGDFATLDPETGLRVLTGQGDTTVPTDQMVSGPRFGALIEQCAAQFDMIVVDTPPAGPVVDAHYLVQHADVLVFITRWASTLQSDVKKTVNRLISALRPGTPVGVVLNQDESSHRDVYYGYSSYHAE